MDGSLDEPMHRTEEVCSCLRIHWGEGGGGGKKGDVHRVLLYDRQKKGTAIFSLLFVLIGGAA